MPIGVDSMKCDSDYLFELVYLVEELITATSTQRRVPRPDERIVRVQSRIESLLDTIKHRFDIDD